MPERNLEMKHEKKTGNIIPFPNVQDRLVEKGMSAMKAKQYKDALSFFSEAMNYGVKDPSELYLGMAICHLELGQLEDAKNTCERMLKEGIGDYFTVLQVYMTILIQLKQFSTVKKTIEAVLEENKLPAEKAEQFYRLLEFSRRMIHEEENDIWYDEEMRENSVQADKILTNKSEQLAFIHSLKDRNLSNYIGLLRTILQDPDGQPVIKTMILQLLADHEYSKEIQVVKFGESTSINPTEAIKPDAMPILGKVLNVLDDTLGNENPTLFHAVEELWRRHIYVIYPFEPKAYSDQLWAAALHKVGYEMYGIEISLKELHMLYDFQSDGFADACAFIKEIEGISYL
jgi:tetratricopeptide (TPR) repeat protein